MRLSLSILLVAGLVPATLHAQEPRLKLGGGPVWLGISGQERLRAERWTGFNATAAPGTRPNDGFGLSRLRLRGDLHVGRTALLVAEAKSSLASHRTLTGGVRTADYDQVDVQQLYGELSASLFGSRWTARGGRFELALGRQRLVSYSDWTNTRRALQGASLRVARGRLDLLAFWARPVTVRRYTPNVGDSTKQLYGVYLSRNTAAFTTQLYWFRNEAVGASFNGTTGYERRHTLGARLMKPAAPGTLDFDVDLAWQTGTVGGAPARAWMIGSVVGRQLRGAWSPRIYAGFDAASGDHQAGGSVQTYDQLFPTGHTFLGYADVHGRQNVLAPTVGMTLAPRRDVVVQLDGFVFWRRSTKDGLYGTDGRLALAAGTDLPSRSGSEADLTVRYTASRMIGFAAGLNYYAAGPYLRSTLGAATRDISFAYAQTTFTF